MTAENNRPSGGIVSDQDLRRLIDSGQLLVEPLLEKEGQVEGGKIDLRLDNVFMTMKASSSHLFDPLRKPRVGSRPAKTPGDSRVEPERYEPYLMSYATPFVLHPGSFALGQTFENVAIPRDYFGVVEGRSSLARRGVLVHITASGIDPGYAGPICLELYNVGRVPVYLRPLMRIASLVLKPMTSEAKSPYPKGKEAKFGFDLRRTDMTKRDADLPKIVDAVRDL